MQRVGEQSENNSRPSSEKRPKRRGEYEVEDVHLGNLTVGESWPERRNVVIVGSEETSIPLFCQADTERCALEDASTGQLVDIIPGKYYDCVFATVKMLGVFQNESDVFRTISDGHTDGILHVHFDAKICLF